MGPKKWRRADRWYRAWAAGVRAKVGDMCPYAWYDKRGGIHFKRLYFRAWRLGVQHQNDLAAKVRQNLALLEPPPSP